MADPHWYDEAACRGVDVEIFYSDRPEATSAALQLCAGCPVKDLCLDMAMESREFFGVWGGTAENQRQRIFRRADRRRRRVSRAA